MTLDARCRNGVDSGVPGVGIGPILRIVENDKAPPCSAQLREQTLIPHSYARSSVSRNN
jgi:hypothetical protein